MLSMWLRGGPAWLVAALFVLHLLSPTGSPVDIASIAALAIAAVVVWSVLRPAANRPCRAGRSLPETTHIVGPMRSFDPDAAGRPRSRAPGA
jgi:Family of unknown function (DUF6412)